MRVEIIVLATVLATASGCAAYGAPEGYGELGASVVNPEPHIEPHDDWEHVERETHLSPGRVYRYGDYYEGTICFQFGTSAASCGDDNTVTVTESETQTFTLAGSFTPPELGISFELSESTSYTTTTSVTFRGEDCQYCWPYICYAMRIEPRERNWRGRWRETSPRVTFTDPVIRRFCQEANEECHDPPDQICLEDADGGVADAGPADAGPPDAGPTNGGADAEAGAGESDGG